MSTSTTPTTQWGIPSRCARGTSGRLTQHTHETDPGWNSYIYDDANRLVNLDGVTFTWDDNGNLLSDGVTTYAYDHANYLVSVT